MSLSSIYENTCMGFGPREPCPTDLFQKVIFNGATLPTQTWTHCIHISKEITFVRYKKCTDELPEYYYWDVPNICSNLTAQLTKTYNQEMLASCERNFAYVLWRRNAWKKKHTGEWGKEDPYKKPAQVIDANFKFYGYNMAKLNLKVKKHTRSADSDAFTTVWWEWGKKWNISEAMYYSEEQKFAYITLYISLSLLLLSLLQPLFYTIRGTT